MIYLWIFARVDADKHRITRLQDFAKSGKERRYLMPLEIAQTRPQPQNGFRLRLNGWRF